MFGQIFLKEWRDKRLLLGLSILLLLMFAVVALASHGQFDPNLMGFFALLFPAFCGLLLGSSGFQAEFKDNAWTYLFSRPVKKGTIWLQKYLSLLSLLAAIVLVTLLVRAIVPGLNQFLSKLGFPADFSNAHNFYPSLLINILLPVLALSISYSLSILTDKSFIIIILFIIIGIALHLLYTLYLKFLWTTYMYNHAYDASFFSMDATTVSAIMLIMIAAGFLAASWRTFSRVDFSQQTKKILSFSKIVAPLLILAFGVSTVVAAKGKIFSTKQKIVSFLSAKISGQAYLGTWTGKIFRYDETLDRVIRMKGSFQDASLDEYSAGEGKFAFFKRRLTLSTIPILELCVSNLDGTHMKSLVQFHGKDSSFNGWEPEYNCLMSPDGRQVAFVASPPRQAKENKTPRLFWMNVDGTGQMSRPLDLKRKESARLISWLPSENSIVLQLAESGLHSLAHKILKFNLDTGSAQTLEITSANRNDYYWMYNSIASPDGTAMLIKLQVQAQNAEKLEILDLRTFETKEIFAAPHIPYSVIYGTKWTRDSEKFAYFQKGALWVYSRSQNTLQEARRPALKGIGLSFDWLADNKRLAILEGNAKECFITILSEDFKEEKRVKIPEQAFKFEGDLIHFGLDNKILVAAEESGAWRLDLATDQWKKVY
jgi:hypothetical protein